MTDSILVDLATPIISIIAIVVTVYITRDANKSTKKIADSEFRTKNAIFDELLEFEAALLSIVGKGSTLLTGGSIKTLTIQDEIEIIKQFQTSKAFLYFWIYYSNENDFFRFYYLYLNSVEKLDDRDSTVTNIVKATIQIIESFGSLLDIDKLSKLKNEDEITQILIKGMDMSQSAFFVKKIANLLDDGAKAHKSSQVRKLKFIESSGINDPAVYVFLISMGALDMKSYDFHKLLEDMEKLYGKSVKTLTLDMVFERHKELLSNFKDRDES